MVLGYATGIYIRLFNDTLSFKKDALKKMLDIIEMNINRGQNLFFYNNMFLHKDCNILFNNNSDFLCNVSYYISWIGNYGCWRQDYENIQEKVKYSKSQFLQVDWSFQIVSNKKKTLIYFDDLFNVVEPMKKGGYNFVNTFVMNYLFVIRQHKISFVSYEIEKFRLCYYFIFPYLSFLTKADSSHTFALGGYRKIMFEKYWYEPYFYVMVALFVVKRRFRL
jgi:hypothetical protein